MASEPFETLLDPFPQTLDGVDHGEIIQKDGASRSGTKLKASRASPQTSFGPRHSIASFFSASLAKLRTPPVPTKKRSRRSELACVFYLHHLLVSAAASTRIPFAATFFFWFSRSSVTARHRCRRAIVGISHCLCPRRLYRSLQLFPSTESR